EPSPGYQVVASVQSDTGCVREVNEDRGRYVEPGDHESLAGRGRLVVVADGMGGHSAGEVASEMAVEVICRSYYEDAGEPAEVLKRAFLRANTEINEAAKKQVALNGMGTTCTALVLRNGSAIAAHVGDSRLYLVRGGQIYLMTEDHSAVMEMVKRGLLSLEEARHHPDKNVILRALGSRPNVEVTIWDESFPVKAGDRFLLCSDGLYDLVEDDEIRDEALSADVHAGCRRLIDMARERGGYDNITVALVAVNGANSGPQNSIVPETRELEAQR
ncbi:MAG TPA: Stp1/IreP family PP2C-type Ser/Thr phosphatase, partial [Blastocatellia bacterium]|nr:Stp1/IreP family PP2C-type Ser/Thr phosphatase [Blastocatellia bacterium]